jgi:hypothetical protein
VPRNPLLRWTALLILSMILSELVGRPDLAMGSSVVSWLDP